MRRPVELEPLTAISPLDGRYRRRVAALAPIASEFGLMRARVRVEAAWFAFLSDLAEVPQLPTLEPAQRTALHAIWRDFTVADAAAIRAIEQRTNHDVKAVEYFVKDALRNIDGLAPHVEFVHFACTSEDVNNVAYALLLQEARQTLLEPAIAGVIEAIRTLGEPLAAVPMLARTHGQPASPTTVGKELGNVVARLRRAQAALGAVEIPAKMNGAVGNYNAHLAAYPNVDWPQRCEAFISGLGLAFNPHTTQIEPHDGIAELCHALMRLNNVLLDFDRDIWGYIALGYFRQRPVAGETGSSTMPHKVNPIDFENSEGNLGLANALLGHLASKLPISRWQRDLSDSTVLRSLGTALGYCLVAYDSAQRGIAKLDVDRARLQADLDDAWEVLAEAVQTVMRQSGSGEPYEQLKELTRGKKLDAQSYRALLAQLPLPSAAQRELATLAPASYTGLATRLAGEALAPAPTAAAPTIAEVSWAENAEALMQVRRAVFIDEQHVPEAEELDSEDKTATHFLAADENANPIGTARLLPSGQIGRMAVLPSWRRRQVGAGLLAAAVAAAAERDLAPFLHAQVAAIGFYERNGFEAVGEVFMEADIEHRKMVRRR